MGLADWFTDRLAAYPLIALLRRESSVALRPMVGIAALSALANVLLLAIINHAAEQASTGDAALFDLVIFLALVAIYNVSQRHVLTTAVIETEEIINRLRTRIADKVRRAELVPLEAVGRSQIYNMVTRDSVTLSNTSPMVVIAIQSSILLVFIAVYLAYLSLPAFLLAVLLTGIAIWVYVRRTREGIADLRKASMGEYEFFDALTDTLEGFKSVKLHRPRGDDLFQHVREISQVVKGLKVEVMTRFSQLTVFGASAFYLVMAAMVFVLPRFSDPASDVVIKSTAAILFLVGPLTALANVIPVVTHASVAAGNIVRVEAALDDNNGRAPAPPGPAQPDATSFREIRFERVVFEYRGPGSEATFRLGPLDFTLTANEVLFLIGGNGSGKSTMLHLLIGLYQPMAGAIVLDGTRVDASNIETYRSLFSTVLSDYHLFRRLYGLRHVPDERVNALLDKLEIGDKTRMADGRFDRMQLSTGQKKRLALAVALLEDRPIYVFDEWAAEQDAVFRSRFYNEILAELKAAGKTVVVVSHDDRYYDVPAIDRVVKLDQGQFTDPAVAQRAPGQ